MNIYKLNGFDFDIIGKIKNAKYETLDKELNLSKLKYEKMYMISYDENLKATGVYFINDGNAISVEDNKIYKVMSIIRDSNFVLLHNHPNGVLLPSSNDIKFNKSYSHIAEMLNCKLLDSIIVSNNHWYGAMTGYSDMFGNGGYPCKEE